MWETDSPEPILKRGGKRTVVSNGSYKCVRKRVVLFAQTSRDVGKCTQTSRTAIHILVEYNLHITCTTRAMKMRAQNSAVNLITVKLQSPVAELFFGEGCDQSTDSSQPTLHLNNFKRVFTRKTNVRSVNATYSVACAHTSRQSLRRWIDTSTFCLYYNNYYY